MKELDVKKLSVDAVDLWMKQWLVLTAGTLEDCNMMTVAWGSIGCMWAKPFAQIVVRPQRHTYKFTEKFETFTLSAFSDEHREALQVLGTISGRDGDKLPGTGLTLKASEKVAAPSYEQANFTLECRKMYYQDMDPDGFTDPSVQKNYAAGDYHRIYFGEILAAFSAE
jgi:flavin reductase (DIM6/NTAB) family NADH-FMN oxidoreductase RutF